MRRFKAQLFGKLARYSGIVFGIFLCPKNKDKSYKRILKSENGWKSQNRLQIIFRYISFSSSFLYFNREHTCFVCDTDVNHNHIFFHIFLLFVLFTFVDPSNDILSNAINVYGIILIRCNCLFSIST